MLLLAEHDRLAHDLATRREATPVLQRLRSPFISFPSPARGGEEEEGEASSRSLSLAYLEMDAYLEMNGYEFERAEIDALEHVIGDPTAKAMSLTFSLLRRITNDFSDAYRIGCGAFSVVHKGVLPSGSCIAVKKLHSVIGLAEDEFENEVLTTMRVAHKNVVRLIGYCSYTQSEVLEYDGKYIFAEARQRLICMEYVPDGTLDKYITDEFHGGLDWNHRYKVLKGTIWLLRIHLFG
ncbi:putative receptor-like protein kinase At4g00960 [Triticum dicoccoides]|uniref:putative receptor-like protein kinase At4g00960 n=1 Tax=Triticum dicoccoides TaxID=85692 RepID=UPI000E78AF9A|nr:putative receptor-like protein kinase At4g00960 [Triticum dicoccoides]